jgi:hypothetical protein
MEIRCGEGCDCGVVGESSTSHFSQVIFILVFGFIITQKYSLSFSCSLEKARNRYMFHLVWYCRLWWLPTIGCVPAPRVVYIFTRFISATIANLFYYNLLLIVAFAFAAPPPLVAKDN